MLIAMVAGMLALGMPAGMVLGELGVSSSELRNDAPALLLLGMATTMTVPMVAWMRYRGHGWAASSEMAASMFIPTFAAIGLLSAGLVEDTETLLVIQHVAMLPAMLIAMLLRREEYSHSHGTDSGRHAESQVGV
jgi:hypothetical protein